MITTLPRRRLPLVGLLSALLTLVACETTTQTAGTSAACLAFEPMTYSSRDTPETKREIVGHNAALAALCPTP